MTILHGKARVLAGREILEKNEPANISFLGNWQTSF